MGLFRGGLLLGLLIGPVSSFAAEPPQFDPAHSQFGFEIRTRFGQKIEGVFRRFDAQATALPNGQHQVVLRMYTQYVEIPDKPRYTGWMRGEDFFDVARYPVIEFRSDPYSPELIHQGGDVNGWLTIRGISRRETLHLAKPECARPGYDCDLVSRGTVQRGRYGMDSWQMALGDRVTFILRTRLSSAPPK
ncbi:polyisoprenoid-binding protein [Stenotrophomonas sp. ATCM1_4]|jgi:polyisoprenoid-binding protein YceI|uniref:YceI family protein n=1 Tax=unclassified Stenotrophomonas TaxID=196198 RepID=UPI001053575C|nr:MULTISPECIES: YceI family protein [unclassified Stenotrophomonas]MBD9537499.1 YceI family protein [Stenotrophomonas sp. STM01]TDB26282.1 polyisoprenoid-binding protein [Stenotrophomonas sp. ATCM1_4]